MDHYSKLDDTPQNTEQKLLHEIRKGDVFYAQGLDGAFKATADATLTDNGSHWLVAAENADFEPKIFSHRKNDMAYAPKLFVEIPTS